MEPNSDDPERNQGEKNTPEVNQPERHAPEKDEPEMNSGAEVVSTEAGAISEKSQEESDEVPEENLKDWSLEHIANGASIQVVPMRRRMRIGRLPECEVCISTIPAMSRLHAHIHFDLSAKRWRIRDVSANGTFVNARRVVKNEDTEISAGDVISFSNSSLANAEGALVVQGPEDAMPEEGEIDTSEFRLTTESARKAQEEDLKRRKDARKAREFRHRALLQAKKQSLEFKDSLQKKKAEMMMEDKKVLHEVSWGMGAEDEIGDEDGDRGSICNVLDYAEVRTKYELTEKQEQMVTKLEQKQRKIDNMVAEKERTERRICEDAGEDGAKNNAGIMSKIQQLMEKIEHQQLDLLVADEALRVALGIDERVDAAELKRRADEYDNNVLFDSDDDFFDHTKQTKVTPVAAKPQIETADTLLLKVAHLEAQIVRITADMAQSSESVSADMDELEAFMAQNARALGEEKREKNAGKKAELEAELAETKRILEIAQYCHDSSAKPKAKRVSSEAPVGEPAAKKTISTQDAINAASEVFALKNKERETLAAERKVAAASELAEDDDHETPSSPRASSERQKTATSILDPSIGGIQVPGAPKPKKVYTVSRPPGM
eukprot:GEMP01029697.1.p1 GENE.GEMP01029697.1~~GEMP01029697.1.p1  ORF type:complete len:607 (+),score=170.12 GEMP01029697.1:110-1930(+)